MGETLMWLVPTLFGRTSTPSGGINQGTSPMSPEHAIPISPQQAQQQPPAQEPGTQAPAQQVTGESRGTQAPQPSVGEQEFVPVVTLQDGTQVPVSDYVETQYQFTLKDGTQVPHAEVVGGYMRQDDYTQKSQANAERRRQLDNEWEWLQQRAETTGTPQDQGATPQSQQEPAIAAPPQMPAIQLDEYASDAERAMASAIQQQNQYISQMTQGMQQLQKFVQDQHASMVDTQLASTMREAAVNYGLVNPEDYRNNPTGLNQAISQVEEEMAAIANQYSLFDDPTQMQLAAEVIAARRGRSQPTAQQTQAQQQEVQRRMQQQNLAAIAAPTPTSPLPGTNPPDISKEEFRNDRKRQEWFLAKYGGKLTTARSE